MKKSKFQSTRDFIIRTEKWAEATKFYNTFLGLPVTMRSKTMMGFETGAFQLFVEKGKEHGPVFEFLVPDVQAAKRKLVAAGCTVLEEDESLPRCYIREPVRHRLQHRPRLGFFSRRERGEAQRNFGKRSQIHVISARSAALRESLS